MTRAFIASTIVSLLLVACASEDANDLNGRNPNGPGGGGDTPGQNPPPGQDPGTTPGADPTQPGGCKEGVPHIGFGGQDFVSDRKPGPIGQDRRRVKPYSALSSEFQRVLGAVPPNLPTSQAAYGQIPARWYSEPQAGAVSLYTTYTLAFTSCYDTMTDAKWQQMPTAATASTECAGLQRKAWQRTTTPEEIKACSDFVQGLTDEPNARRRWAHACAAVLTSTGFTSY
jgi:hypothetical protein